MDETELEEGEACYNGYDDSPVDPDVSLSYIDEKLQNVLGHLQKDFEGGVSAENLGAKFGGYGSFLPTYQRSPIFSHPRTPQNGQNHSPFRNYFQLQEGNHNAAIPASVPLPVKHGPETAGTEPLLANKALSERKSAKTDVGMLPAPTKELSSRYEIARNSSNPQEQKMPKLRIIMGSDHLSTRKKDSIYSGLGLEISPSSSVGDSPADSKDLSHKPHDAPYESPNTILRIMTTFQIPGGVLLSPLSDDLKLLAQRGKARGDKGSSSIPRGGRRSSGYLVNEGAEKVLDQNQGNSIEKESTLPGITDGTGEDAHNCVAVCSVFTSQKEGDVDASACKDIVSKKLKLPFLSTSRFTNGDSAKDTCTTSGASRAKDNVVKDNYNADPVMDSTHVKEFGSCSKQTEWNDPAGKSGENGLDNFNNDDGIYPRKGTMGKEDKNSESLKVGSKSSKGKKASQIDMSHSSKSNSHMKATPLKQIGKCDLLASENLSSGRKKKSKVSQNHNTLSTLAPEEDFKAGSFLVHKANKKDSPFGDPGSKIESGKIRLQKGSVKASDRYRDFFGDLSPEQDIEVDSFRRPSEERLRESEVTSSSRDVPGESKVRFNGKKDEKHLALQQAPGKKPIAQVAPAANGTIPEGPPAKAAPEVIEEHWVSCDKCETWRLLPFGTNPDSLPEKWVCSMLNWLPGMNSCSFSQDETTAALISLYQVPVSENQSNFHGQPKRPLSRLAQADIQHSGQNHRRLSYHAEPNSTKKSHGSTGILNTNGMQERTVLKISMRSLQPSVKSRSLNEKQKHDKKENHGLLEHFSDAGDKKSKSRNHKVVSQDDFRPSKKIRVEAKHDNDEGWVSGADRHFRKGDSSTADILPTYVVSKGHPRYNCSSSWKDSDFDGNECLPVAARTKNDQSQYSIDRGSHEIGKVDTKRFLMKKRKLKDSENFRELNSTRQLEDIMEPVKEEFSANEHRKEKKSRLNTIEIGGGKDRACIGKKEKMSRSTKDQKLGPALVSNLSQGIGDGMNSLNRDTASTEHSLPANSSSSKVSGSSRNNTKLQDVKGSPVESVSSSPLRFPSKHDLPLNDRSSVEKDDFNVDFATEGSPRRYIDENDGGSDRSGTDSGKDRVHTVNNHGSLESSVLDIQEPDRSHLSKDRANEILVASSDLKNESLTKDANNSVQHPGESWPPGRCDEQLRSSRSYHNNELLPRKTVNGSSRSKDKSWTSKSNFNSSNPSGSLNESEDYVPSSTEKKKDRKNRLQQKPDVKACKVEKKSGDRRDSAGRLLDETSKLGFQSKLASRDSHDLKCDALHVKDALLAPIQILAQGKKEGSSTTSLSEKVEVGSGRTKSTLEFVSPGTNQNDNRTSCSQRSSARLTGNGADIVSVDPSKGSETTKRSKQATMCDKQTGDQYMTARHPTPNGHRIRDLDASSPLLRDASSQAATIALREAQKLKHTADRLKNSGSGLEGTRLYFEASLKFLDAASLYESGSNENAKHGDLAQSREIYHKTAKLCEFCAREFERSRDMATASLAYKCTEVAYLRVIYAWNDIASRDRAELQTNLHNILPGESPSSSASDVDNLNNMASVDKITLLKDVSSPQVVGNQVIPARNRLTFERLLDFIRDTNCALEASKKSWFAFETANGSFDETQIGEECISSIKRALDFSFHDVEGFVRLVRVAMEALGR